MLIELKVFFLRLICILIDHKKLELRMWQNAQGISISHPEFLPPLCFAAMEHTILINSLPVD
jgi:hypothetical protein